MSEAPRGGAIPIGEVANPPFVRLPDPASLFRQRAQRFLQLSQGHELGPYLYFLAGLSEAQHRIQDGLPEPQLPAADAIERAHQFEMPPLARDQFAKNAVFDTTLDRLLALAPEIEMPNTARDALARLTKMDAAGREALVQGVLTDSAAIEALAEHAYVAAGLQVHFARLASKLDGKKLKPVGDGACPTCGGPPVSSMVVGWQGSHNTRFCSCALCATLWHVVRIKCTLCGSTKGVAYQEIEDGPGAGLIRAETCDNCRCYVKVLQEVKSPELDPVADDVATLALDLLMRQGEYRRGAVNPYLLGY